MIEINLLPGNSKKARGPGGGAAVGAALANVAARVKDPFLLAAAGSIVVAAAVVALLYLRQDASANALTASEQKQVQDSTRYAAVLREKRKAETQRDSVMHQLSIIRAIDNNRFVWPHIMDEVSRSLPQYTWLVSVQQTVTPPPPTPTDPKDKKKHADEEDQPQPIKFKVIGNTVDIQALTRFMKLLEASPFIQNVQLEKSDLVASSGTEVTEFTLDAEYKTPDSTAIRTVPLTLSVR
jgi:type IV pilus assembly protein PilN